MLTCDYRRPRPSRGPRMIRAMHTGNPTDMRIPMGRHSPAVLRSVRRMLWGGETLARVEPAMTQTVRSSLTGATCQQVRAR